MKRAFSLLIFYIVFSLSVSAQQVVNLPMPGGRPIPSESIDNVKGNPYLSNTWDKGTVKLKDTPGDFTGMELMYDQVSDKLLFKKGDDKFEFLLPVESFTIGEGPSVQVFKSGFPPVLNNTEKSFYEVLKDGQIKLLKQTKKEVVITKGYNQVTEKRYDQRLRYFVLDSNKIYEIKPTKKGIATAISEQGLKANELLVSNPSIRNEKEFIEFFTKLP